MATRRAPDPEVAALMASIRDRLMRAPDRAGALRYVHFVLDAWNGEPLARPQVDATTIRARQREAEARSREQERCPDCAKWSQRYTDALGAAIADLKRKGQNDVTCPAHPTLVWHDAETPTTPEDTLREAGISNKRQARYQRRMSSLLAGRA